MCVLQASKNSEQMRLNETGCQPSKEESKAFFLIQHIFILRSSLFSLRSFAPHVCLVTEHLKNVVLHTGLICMQYIWLTNERCGQSANRLKIISNLRGKTKDLNYIRNLSKHSLHTMSLKHIILKP